MGALGAGCAGEEAEEPTLADVAAVQRCSESEVRELVATFVDAFNAGDLAELDRLVAPADSFKWYTVDGPGRVPGERGATGERETLIPYFSRRHARGERLELRGTRFNGNTLGYGNFSYRLRRRADDLAATHYFGKGAAICTSGEDMIIVWSMGTGQRG